MTRTQRLLASVSVTLGVVVALTVTRAQQPGVKRTDLQRHELGVPGREVIQVRVELAPGVSFGRHWHPGEEVIYMLEGILEYEVDGKPPVTLKAGDVLFIPARKIHSARNPGRTNGAELATYLVEQGQPLVTMVK
jgi:quercetin dioxygenase-like cupin family protein